MRLKIQNKKSDKKREIDSLLINGYFADHSIQELMYLNDYLEALKTN